MTDNDKPSNGAVPPKIDLRKSGLVKEQGAAPEQPGAVPPAAAAPTPEGATPGRQPLPTKKQTARIELPPAADLSVTKKKTSRISLESAAPEGQARTAAQAVPKTIRIKRPPTAPPPEPIPASLTELVAPAPESEKKRTSRIPLESALGVSEGGEAGKGPLTTAAPKTIRIRRPGQAAAPEAPPAEAAPTAAPEGAPKSQTSRIEMPTGTPEAGGAPTQRKTIKIRRPGGEAKVSRTISVARTEEELAPPEAAEEESVGVGPVFAVAALVSVLIICVLLYVLAVQALPGLNLHFPGQV